MTRSYAHSAIRTSSSFLATFARSIDKAEARELYDVLRNPVMGYTWSGSMRHRAKYAGSVLTKDHIIPFTHRGLGRIGADGLGRLFRRRDRGAERVPAGLFSSLLEASKLKDNDTGKHIERVNYYTERMAKEMYRTGRWPEVDIDFVDNIGFLAAMHDVGKIGTPDDILNKKGPLDEFEWNIMKEHTINGAFILSSYPNPMAKQIAQSHHEWWNGTGYPYNLVGDMIPLPARIVALADVYDALRMKRSYKKPFDHGRAALLIQADSDTHFDPNLVSIFSELESDFDKIYKAHKDD